GPRVLGAGNEFRDLWVRRIGDVHDGPAAVPKVAHIEVPVVPDVANGHFEGAAASVELTVSNRLHVAGRPAGRNLIGIHIRRREPEYHAGEKSGEKNGPRNQIPHTHFHERISPYPLRNNATL